MVRGGSIEEKGQIDVYSAALFLCLSCWCLAGGKGERGREGEIKRGRGKGEREGMGIRGWRKGRNERKKNRGREKGKQWEEERDGGREGMRVREEGRKVERRKYN